MRSLFKGLLATSCALAVVATGCSERKLRPLTPCTTAGVSNSVPIDDIKNVDLLFMVDDSGSMRQKQAKLRDEFPNMVRALLTGDSDPLTPGNEWPPVQSLRIAVVTSDMGVAGVGTTAATAGTKIASCGANPALPGGIDANRAHYGDDGAFRLQGQTVRVSGQTLVNCDVNPMDGTDDSVTAAGLPAFLTFDNMTGGAPDPTMLNEYVRRVSCFTNTGTAGCAFEQQLESMLKAVTPSDAATADGLVGGRFYHAMGEDARGLGQGTDTNTSAEDMTDPAANGGWLRNDSLLAVVLVTDEEDCSSDNPLVYDFNSTDPNYTDPYGRFQSQTRCARNPELTFDPQRYVQGLLALRAGRERLLVFGAITGVPSDLTDGSGAGVGIIEGTDNLDAILADDRMAYHYDDELQPAGMNNAIIPVPFASLRPACQHVEPGKEYDATGDVTDGSTTLANFVIGTAVTGTPISATGTTMLNGSSITNIMIPTGAAEIVAGMTITGAGIANGTTITAVQGDVATTGPFTAFLSQPTTAAATGVALTIGASYGPAVGQLVVGAGIPPATTIQNVAGTGPYTITLSDAVAGNTATGIALTVGKLDASATPARRAALVGQGLYNAGANVTLQSICVDSFAPAMGQILRLIQSNLAGSCLPRPLNRNALSTVTCDVFVTLPPNTACADTPGMLVEDPQPTVATTDTTDTDGKLERCRMQQVPVTAADRGSNAPPTSAAGWFYDDYTSELSNCTSTQRISFTTGALAAKPPQGSVMKFGCIQPVQDGNLSVDLNAACNASSQCPFPSEDAYDEFVLRYNLEPRGWADTSPALDPASLHQLQCEPNSLTCQVPCLTDANCPGGFVCFDQQSLDPMAQSFLYCVNPTCGSGQ